MAYPVSQLKVVATEGSLTAAEYNAEFQNVYQNVGKPQNVDDYSVSVVEMQTMTDPGEIGSESQATTLAGEIERLRFAIRDTKQVIDPTVTQWYETPASFTFGTALNADLLTIYAQVETFDSTVLTLKCDAPNTENYNFIECINDANGTPDTVFEVNQSGGAIIDGETTINNNLIVNGNVTFNGTTGLSGSEFSLLLASGDEIIPGTSGLPLVSLGAGFAPVYAQVSGDFIGASIATNSANKVATSMDSSGANAIINATTSGHNIPATSANRVRQNMTKTIEGVTANIGNMARSNIGNSSTQSNTWISPTAGSVTITTSGRPVLVKIQPRENTSSAYFAVYDANARGEAKGGVRILRNGSSIAFWYFEHDTGSSTRPFSFHYWPGDVSYIDGASAGTHTYQVQIVNHGNTSDYFYISNCAIVAVELT